ncbi:hypothetical protein [Pseudomonas sp. USHLN015]|uniref:hypothetical protein n=1 Tax=Pseudomonas sp. USHLN015 TaxID=3081296 RepID=UPI00301E1434
MAKISQIKVVAALPAELVADAIYYVRVDTGFDIYVTNSSGTVVAYPSNYQRKADSLGALAALTGAANKLAYFTSSTAAALTDLTVFGRMLIAAADAAAARLVLGLGTAAVREATTSATDTTSERLWRTNDLVKQTSPLDATAGSMVGIGGFGIGVQLVMTDPELNNYRAGGKYITPASGLLNLPPGWAQGRQVMEVAGSNYSAQMIYGGSSNFSRIANRVFAPTTGAFTPWYEVLTNNSLVQGTGIALTFNSSTGQVTVTNSTGWGGNLPLDNTNVNASTPTHARVVQASNRGKPAGTTQDGYYIRYSYIQGAGAYAVEQYAELSSITPRWFTRGTVNGVLPADWLEYLTSQSVIAGSGVTVDYNVTTGKVTIAATSSGGGMATKAAFRGKVLAGVLGYAFNFNDPDLGQAAGFINPRVLSMRLGYTASTWNDYADIADHVLDVTGTSALVSATTSGTILQLDTGTTTTGYAGIKGQGTNFGTFTAPVQVGSMQEIHWSAALAVPNLSDGTNRYLVQAGLDYPNGSPAEMAYFSYTDNVNSGRWQFNYINAAGSIVSVDTGITPSAGVSVDAEITYTWNASTSQFDLVAKLSTWTSSVFTSNRINLFLAIGGNPASFRQRARITKALGATSRSLRLTRLVAIATVR